MIPESAATFLESSPSVPGWEAGVCWQPLEVARALRMRPGFVWLDSAAGGEGAMSILACEPRAVLGGDIFHPDDRARLRRAWQELAAAGAEAAGLIGMIDYDGRFCFGVYEQWLVYEHDTRTWRDDARVASLLGEVGWGATSGVSAFGASLSFQPEWHREGFCEAVQRALDYIAAGDIYQVNLAQSWACPWRAGEDAFPLYERLRVVSPAPQGAFLSLGRRQVLSVSPELFLRMNGHHVMTRPIKGTRPRHVDPARDAQAAAELRASPKETAELVMITDLERNDLGQVCAYGSVRVVEMLRLETYPQVFHLVSTVEGTLRPEMDHIETLAACFPGGSITGAPKKRAREIIAELEPRPRGLFTGAIGYFGTDGTSQFSIAIRTAVAEVGVMRYHAGAGIVADSNPLQEFEETYHKAAALFTAVQSPLTETPPLE